MTLICAIASAKVLSEFARQEEVVILCTVEGRKMAGRYNIAAIRRGAYDGRRSTPTMSSLSGIRRELLD